jgi:UPF0271 protein
LRIDINADVGESFGPYTIGDDAAVMRSVSSVSIAAGFHGGDPSVLRRTLAMARDLGIAVGAHPSFADRQGFGRREMRLSPRDAEDLVLYQVAAVAGVAQAEGMKLAHVKPHGALVPRSEPGAVIVAVEEVVNRAIQMAVDRTVTAIDGSSVLLDIDTLCIHGDNPGAAAMAAWLRAGLSSAGVDVRAPGA